MLKNPRRLTRLEWTLFALPLLVLVGFGLRPMRQRWLHRQALARMNRTGPGSIFLETVVALAPDGRMVATNRWPLIVWRDARTATVIRTIKCSPNNAVEDMMWSPDSRYFIIADEVGLRILDRRTGQERQIKGACLPLASRMEISPDSHFVAGTFKATGLQIYDLRSGLLVANLGQIEQVHDLTFSRDGKAIVAAGFVLVQHHGEKNLVDLAAEFEISSGRILWTRRAKSYSVRFTSGRQVVASIDFVDRRGLIAHDKLVTMDEHGIARVWDISSLGNRDATKSPGLLKPSMLLWTFDTITGEAVAEVDYR